MSLRQALATARAAQHRVIGVVAGSGEVSRAAVAAGADFLVALSAGAFRARGHPSLAAFLPFADANQLTADLVDAHLRPHAGACPLLAGCFGRVDDPSLTSLLAQYREARIPALTHWPTVSSFDGQFRAELEADGHGLAAEIETLQAARRQGFEIFPFAYTLADAEQWARAGVDGLILVMGLTRGVDDPREKRDRLQQAVAVLNAMQSAVHAIAPQLPCIAYGGPVNTPEDLEQLFRFTSLDGFAGGSVFERLPQRDITGATVRRFKSVAAGGGKPLGAGLGRMLGQSPAMRELFRLIERIAPYDVGVLIEGETGAGKELVAGQIHRLSSRAHQPFVTLNCGALPETLLESELFGHEKGAFTGADRRRPGKFELAHGGTLFLDEVASLSPHGQVALLRALQQREIVRIGGDAVIPVDVRVIAASNVPLAAQVELGRFRVDLYHRLNQFTLTVPPLRERGEDLQLLSEHILAGVSTELNKRLIGLSPRFLERLAVHTWPGNVRELQHVILQAALREDGPVLDGVFFVPQQVLAAPGYGLLAGGGGPVGVERMGGSLSGAMSGPGLRAGPRGDSWRQTVERAYRDARGNKARTAAVLGVTRKTLYSWLRECGLF